MLDVLQCMKVMPGFQNLEEAHFFRKDPKIPKTNTSSPFTVSRDYRRLQITFDGATGVGGNVWKCGCGMDGRWDRRVENRLANRISFPVIYKGHWSPINYKFNSVLNGNFTVRMAIQRTRSKVHTTVSKGSFWKCSGSVYCYRPQDGCGLHRRSGLLLIVFLYVGEKMAAVKAGT